MRRKNRVIVLLAGLFSLLLLVASGCNNNSGENGQGSAADGKHMPVLADGFAAYNEVPVQVQPAVLPYRVEPGLSNISNKDTFDFTPEAQQLIVKNGFVVTPADPNLEFFMLYEINRYQPVPNFITTDSMLHNYHLFFSHLLRVTEKEKLAPALQQLTAAMLQEAEKQYRDLRGSSWENAALRNLGFFAVAGNLLDVQFTVPQAVRTVVADEMRLLNAADGLAASPLMNMGQKTTGPDALLEDYSQYVPRGHYAGDQLLESYFQAMMWYGRMNFRLSQEDETKTAVLMTLALNSGDNGVQWEAIYQPTTFFVGRTDDLCYEQYRELLREIYGSQNKLKDVAVDGDKWESFLKAAAELEPPQINSIPIFDETIQPHREQEIKGFRFMGQRFTLDAAVFQRLVYRDVGENSQGQRRMLPQGLDLPAALGSREAYAILETAGAADYARYPENMQRLQQYHSSLDQKNKTWNLYGGWLYALESLLPEYGEGYPSFMRTKAWVSKDLQTFLGSWTELKHDTLLYAKQVYAEMGGGLDDYDDRGYVEPNPQLYARLAALVGMTKTGLAARDLLDPKDQESLDRLEQLALSLKKIAEKELTNTALTDDEYELIRSYGGQLEHFWLQALSDQGVTDRSALAGNPAALVADVATNPEGYVLQEATGHIHAIFVVVPVDGSLRIAKGGVYSHYEFTQPLNERLTDQKWQAMLDSGAAPAQAGWIQAFQAP